MLKAIGYTDVDLSPDSDDPQRRAFNVRGAQTVLTAAAAEGVGRVVLVTSAMVYGAHPDNPVPLAETAPLRADPDTSVAGDLLEIEHLARRDESRADEQSGWRDVFEAYLRGAARVPGFSQNVLPRIRR